MCCTTHKLSALRANSFFKYLSDVPRVIYLLFEILYDMIILRNYSYCIMMVTYREHTFLVLIEHVEHSKEHTHVLCSFPLSGICRNI